MAEDGGGDSETLLDTIANKDVALGAHKRPLEIAADDTSKQKGGIEHPIANHSQADADSLKSFSISKVVSRTKLNIVGSRRADQYGTLRTAALFAAVADAINTLVTPDFFFNGMNITGTFCNFSGSWMAGLSAVLVFGPNSEALSAAFRGGFVAAYTSFTHMVEHSSQLHCGRLADSSSHFYLVMSLLGGPVFFQLGGCTGEIIKRLVGSIVERKLEPSSLDSVLTNARYFLIVCITMSILVAYSKGGGQSAIELCVGMAMASLACYAGECVSLAIAELMKDFETGKNDVNWGTIACNTVALMIVNVLEYSSSFFDKVLPAFMLIVVDKLRGSFCGALSSYGGYSEDVFEPLRKGKAGVSAANLGMHALVVLLAIAFLSHAKCPLGMGLLWPVSIGTISLLGLEYAFLSRGSDGRKLEVGQ